MTTLNTIINRAYRVSQILDIDREPSDAQVNEALALLRGIIRRHLRPPVMTVWLGSLTSIKRQKGQVFKDFTPYVRDLSIPQDVYVNVNATEAYDLFLPSDPGDGARLVVFDYGSTFATNPLTLIGNGNLIDTGPELELNTNGQRVELMYRRDLANWQLISTLGLSQNLPFAEDFDIIFEIELAMNLNPRYGNEMGGVLIEVYRSALSMFNSRYMSETSSAAPDILWDPSIAGLGNASGDRGYR